MCSHCLTDKSFSLLQSLPRQTVPSNGPCGPMGAFRIISRRGNSGPRGAYVFSFDRYCQSTFQNKPSVNSPTSRSARAVPLPRSWAPVVVSPWSLPSRRNKARFFFWEEPGDNLPACRRPVPRVAWAGRAGRHRGGVRLLPPPWGALLSFVRL